MIIIRAESEQEEQEIAALLEQTLKGRDVDVFQNDNDEHTTEDILTFLAYNTKQVRIYIGRIERNTRSIETQLKEVNKNLAPLAAYATRELIDSGDDPEFLKRLERQRTLSRLDPHEGEIRPHESRTTRPDRA